MNEQELKKIWQESNAAQEKINIHSPQLLSNMDQELKRFERRINKRDRREIIVAILSIFYLIYVVFSTSDNFRKIGAILLILYVLFVIYKLASVRNKKPPFGITQSLKDQLINYRSYVLQQQKLIKTVLYWYLLPMLPGLIFLLISMKSITIIITSILMSVMFIAIYRMNQRAAEENYTPLLKEINFAIDKLEMQE